MSLREYNTILHDSFVKNNAHLYLARCIM